LETNTASLESAERVNNELALKFGGTNLPSPMLHLRKPLSFLPVRTSVLHKFFWYTFVFSVGLVGGARYGHQLAELLPLSLIGERAQLLLSSSSSSTL